MLVFAPLPCYIFFFLTLDKEKAMKKFLGLIFGTLFFTVSFQATPVHAENALKWFEQIQLNGLVGSSYSYNFNRPTDSLNDIRVFDTDDNSLKMDVAELVFQKKLGELGSAGFRTDLVYGSSVAVIEQAEGSMFHGEVDLQQAYVSYLAPIGNGLQIDFGKFVTHLGLEVIEGYDGWNYNHSRSILFGYAIPFTHVGLKASYSFNEIFSAMAMVANGWDVTIENNDGKTIGFQLGAKPCKGVTLLFNYAGGSEADFIDQQWRNIFDVVAIIAPMDRLEFQFNMDYGTENMGPTVNDLEWWGFAGVVRYAFTDAFSLNLRGEYFDDTDAFRTGTAQELWEITLTPEFKVTDNLIFRVEYRHDESNAGFFSNHGQPDNGQDTIAMNALFYF